MDYTNIPAAISTFDVYLVIGEENNNSGRKIVWQEVFELPVQPNLLFKNNTTIMSSIEMNFSVPFSRRMTMFLLRLLRTNFFERELTHHVFVSLSGTTRFKEKIFH